MNYLEKFLGGVVTFFLDIGDYIAENLFVIVSIALVVIAILSYIYYRCTKGPD